MRSKALASLLVLGWVMLSGLDLVEDLTAVPSHGVIASAASPDGLKYKRDGWGALADNIVESAARLPHVFFASCDPTICVIDRGFGSEFRRYFPRHKLYRVFLI